MVIKIRIDPDDFRYKIKTPTLKERVRRELVISALIEAAGNGSTGQLKLPVHSNPLLDKFYRYEVLSMLAKIAKEDKGVFIVDESNYPMEPIPANEREDTLDFAHIGRGDSPPRRPIQVPETTPISLTLLRGFDNWKQSHLHKKAIQLSDLSPANFQKIHGVITDIDERFQLTSSPDVDIQWYPSGSFDNHDARQDALNFLANKGVIRHSQFVYSSMGGVGRIKVTLNLEEFETFKREVYKLAKGRQLSDRTTEKPEAPQDAKHPFKTRKWEEITVQFVDGNHVKITSKSVSVTAHYKEMGFEDARTRKPDRQWELLRLFAMKNGELSWEDSEAKATIKKKKQLLSKSLQAYFGIKGDPFFPYKEEKSYRLKITLFPESKGQ